jgi:hypothetical protein
MRPNPHSIIGDGHRRLPGADSMLLNVAQKLITAHLVDGSLRAGTPITVQD